MPLAAAGLEAATPGGLLLVLVLLVPVIGALLSVVVGGRHVERIALGSMGLGVALALALVAAVLRAGAPLVYLLGGWAPPLGVALRGDGLAAAMLLTAALIVGATGLYARAEFRTPAGVAEARAPYVFWTLLLAVWGALNVVCLAGDLFTAYVGLELLTFAAVPLVCLDGRAETLTAALRYLLFALLGSALYLLGTVLLYGTYGTLDIALLAAQVRADQATIAAAALMTVGLLAKTALFPLHLWLPPAHAGAPAAASAVLSALVVKGSFFLVVRLWFDAMPGLPGHAGTQLLAGLGAAAILVGNTLALRQERLKLMIAYSTVAQIGYLFLMFPLAFSPAAGQLVAGAALSGGLLQAISHATAKAAMFMVAGLIGGTLGHDRLDGLGGVARALPMSVFAFAIAGVSLVGLPPSGGFLAKWLLLSAALASGQWWWAVVMVLGGLLTAAYVFRIVASTFGDPPAARRPLAPAPRQREAVALALALTSALLGLAAFGASDLLLIGRAGAAVRAPEALPTQSRICTDQDPLTLTLSLQERGPLHAPRWLPRFPLPQGEGQGEGIAGIAGAPG